MSKPISVRTALAMALGAAAMLVPVSSLAQDQDSGGRRTRVLLGPQLSPASPGSKDVTLGPFIEFDRARPGEQFEFSAPDESFGFPLIKVKGFELGPSLGFEGERAAEDIGAPLSRVGFSVEAGAFIQVYLAEPLRLRVEGRKGVTGHKGVVGTISADYILRDGDRWLVSFGPRVTLADKRYHRAYFGVTPADAVRSGLPAYAPGGGVQAVGATLGFNRQLSRRWGIGSYARYDRLVGDAADSPVTRRLGSRDQFSGGIGLSYTFGRLR